MSEIENQGNANGNGNQPHEESAEHVKRDFGSFWSSVRTFFIKLLDIRTDTDQEATKQAIVQDIAFRGHTIWILICSIFICCIGLNANSTAVVIGAMLISPLMGPILGVGLAFATNDIDTLRRSVKNGLIMVVYSVLTAYLFFEFFPLQYESSELLARTSPDIRDVLIAFFGGLALVIARAKRGTVATVIFGVAIATALMPPLCTVGFGIAIGNFEYFTGALYLFTINAIFIALATFIILKVLRLPLVRYARSQTRRLFARIAWLVAVLVMVPASITFYNVWRESRFKRQAQDFLAETIDVYQFKENGFYLDNLTQINYNDDVDPSIELVTVGDEMIPDNVINTWLVQKDNYSRLVNTEIKLVQGGRSRSEDRFTYVNELYEVKKAELEDKNKRIAELESEVASLSRRAGRLVPFRSISAEARANYQNIERLAFSYKIETDFKKIDTIPVFEVKWSKGANRRQRRQDFQKLHEWLKLRLNDNRIRLYDVSG